MGPLTSASHIALDIHGVPGRPCRLLQERIAEFALNGRPRFEWEALRHRWLLERDPTIFEYCQPCPLNVFHGIEGCRGAVENVETFLRVLARLYPESPWTLLPLDSRLIDSQRTRELAADLARVEELLHGTPWKVAQLYRDGRPLLEHFPDGSHRPRLYPWNGEAPPAMISANEGYQVFLCAHGLVVKAVLEDPVPYAFTKLWRDGQGVFGLTGQGETVGFQMNMAHFPEWDPEEPRAQGELRMAERPASEVFRDTLDILAVFTGLAVEADAGFFLSAD